MTTGRKLRVVPRAEPNLRLLDDGEASSSGHRPLELGGQSDEKPIVLVRVGAKDLQAACSAIRAQSRPSGVVVGLGELGSTVRSVRLASEALEVPWGSDPLRFKTTLPGYKAARSLQDLDYTPGRNADPFSIADLTDAAFLRQIVRKAVGHQFDMGVGFVFAGGFVVSSHDDPMLDVVSESLAISIDARDARDTRPIVAPVMVKLNAFSRREQQALLVRRLSTQTPDAYLMHFDGLHENSSPQQILSALRLMLALQSVSSKVLLGRAGDVRHIALAAGVAGVECGLGRLLRFAIPDYTKESGGGPGANDVRFEFESLVSSLPSAAARAALTAERLPECACQCDACSGAESVEDRLRAASGHDLHSLVRSSSALGGQQPSQRVAALDDRIARALWNWSGVTHPSSSRAAVRLDRWRRVLDSAVAEGLSERDGAADALGLTG